MSNSFGEFDPRFLGISLGVSSARRWDLLSKYAFGPETLTDGDALRLDDEDFLEQISCLTVLAHEIRHFHDYIISIHGSRMMQARCALAFNVIMLMAGIYADEGSSSVNAIPAPLSVWCKMPQAERDGFLEDLNSAVEGTGRQFAAPNMPFLSESGDLLSDQPGTPGTSERITQAVKACAQAERRLYDLDALPEGVHAQGGFGPTQIWEASAVIIQCQEILKASGENSLNRFMQALNNPGNRYGAAIKRIYTVFQHAGIEADTERMLEFIMWCLLGDPYQSGKYASPLVRFAKLGGVLLNHGPRAMRSSVEENFEIWDSLTSNESTLDSLSESIDRDNLFCEFLSQKIQETGIAEEGDSFADLLEMVSQFQAVRRGLIGQVLADTRKYGSPRHYLDSLAEMSSPPIKIVVERGLAALRMDGDFEDNSWHLYAGKEITSTGETVGMIVGPPVRTTGATSIDREAAFAAYTQFTLSDILFGPDIVDVPQSDWENTDDALLGRSMSLLRINR